MSVNHQVVSLLDNHRQYRKPINFSIKRLENVRTDWTRLAREFQEELYRRVFMEEPYEAFVRDTVAAVLAGERDAELVCRKRLRRRLEDYQRNVPPHVQAARLCAERSLPVPSRARSSITWPRSTSATMTPAASK